MTPVSDPIVAPIGNRVEALMLVHQVERRAWGEGREGVTLVLGTHAGRIGTAPLWGERQAWAAGLTCIHDFDDPSCLVALQLLRERGELGLRVVKNINDPYIEHAHALGIRWGFGDEWLRIGGLKIFADGALGPRTAHMIGNVIVEEADPAAGEFLVSSTVMMAEYRLDNQRLFAGRQYHRLRRAGGKSLQSASPAVRRQGRGSQAQNSAAQTDG